MASDRELMRIHVETLFTLDGRGRLLRVNEQNGKPAPRFFLGRTAELNDWWFRHDLEPELTQSLEAVCRADTSDTSARPPHGSAKYEALLSRAAPVERTWAGPAYRFPDRVSGEGDAVPITNQNADVLRAYFQGWLDDPVLLQPMFGVVLSGDAVSLCASVRISAGAHEAGVETARDFRGRGYGSRAVAAWAAAVRGLDRISLYSTSWENQASQGLARRLGLVQFGSDLHIT